MFKAELLSKLRTIFQIPKVTFDLPGDTLEQECLYIDVQSARSNIRKKYETALVRGSISIFANGDKLPFGYFSKKIYLADASLTKDLFFFNMDENIRQIQNIVERRCNFIFLYKADFDPEGGSLTDVNFGGP